MTARETAIRVPAIGQATDTAANGPLSPNASTPGSQKLCRPADNPHVVEGLSHRARRLDGRCRRFSWLCQFCWRFNRQFSRFRRLDQRRDRSAGLQIRDLPRRLRRQSFAGRINWRCRPLNRSCQFFQQIPQLIWNFDRFRRLGRSVGPHLCGRPRRLRKSPPCRGKRLAKILPVEPAISLQALGKAILPQPADLDVELALVLLVDRLNPVPGDGPLPPDPEDIAMQGHFQGSFPRGSSLPALTKIASPAAQATPRATIVPPVRGMVYRSRAITFSPPI